MYGNPENLPIIQTARNIKAINAAVAKGYQIILNRAETNPPFKRSVDIYRNTKTGHFKLMVDPRDSYRDPDFHLWKPALKSFEVDLPQFKYPFAAYLVPKDLAIGTRVWIEDLIEDFLGSSGPGFDEERLESSPAVWNGQDFEIDYQPGRDVSFVIG